MFFSSPITGSYRVKDQYDRYIMETVAKIPLNRFLKD